MATRLRTSTTNWTGKKPDPKGSFGFIYLITNLINNRMYVGKKQYEFTSYKKQVESKRRKKVIIPSDWRTYKGSSKYLKEDIDKYGADNFKFEIIWNCSSRGMLYWMEVRELVLRNVLLERVDGSDLPLYYNRQIGAVKFIPKGTYK